MLSLIRIIIYIIISVVAILTYLAAIGRIKVGILIDARKDCVKKENDNIDELENDNSP